MNIDLLGLIGLVVNLFAFWAWTIGFRKAKGDIKKIRYFFMLVNFYFVVKLSVYFLIIRS